MSLIDALKNRDFTAPDEYEPTDYLRRIWAEGLDRLIVPEGYDSIEYLEKLSCEGLDRRYPSITDGLRSRLEHELDAIKTADLTSGFLLVYDFFTFLKKNDIAVSPGCGSQPACLVSYCLGITDIDPFKNNLLFERFINRSMTAFFPGVSIQMEIGGSKLLTDYIVEKYGEGMPAFLESLDIQYYDLKELSIIKETVKRIIRNTGNLIELSKIDYEDTAVYDFIKSEKTDDLYFLNEITSKTFVEEQKLRSFDDLVARLALDRFGPDELSCPVYIKNQNNVDNIEYECPELVPILDSTYGCIIYQEQIMQILNHMGGLSLEQSDLARRDMAKKKSASIEAYRKYFISGDKEKGIPGCVGNGIDESVAERIFSRMVKAAAFAFNKSHAVACAIITYRMAWLKYYFNQEFTESAREHILN